MLYRDVDQIVRNSQDVDKMKLGNIFTCDGGFNVPEVKDGVNGTDEKRKKQHVFKEPESDYKVENLTKKQFAPESKRKIKWAVNLFG